MDPDASELRATFGQRLGAYVIDAVIINVVSLILIRGTAFRDFLAFLVLFVVYFTLFEGSRSGQTLGKRAVNIRVVDFESGQAIDQRRALTRSVSRLASGFVFLLGYLWMLWDRDGQTWHDKIASTKVVAFHRAP